MNTRELVEHFNIKYGFGIGRWDWIDISASGVLTEEFIDMYPTKLHWPTLWRYQRVSEVFIEKYLTSIKPFDWRYISQYQVLSEAFIDKYLDKLSPALVLQYQKVSIDFIKSDKILRDTHNLMLSSLNIQPI